jgi:hypothetical protein
VNHLLAALLVTGLVLLTGCGPEEAAVQPEEPPAPDQPDPTPEPEPEPAPEPGPTVVAIVAPIADLVARVAGDQRLQRMAEQHRAFGARVRGAFDTVAAEEVPPRVRDSVTPPRARASASHAAHCRRMRSFIRGQSRWYLV